MKIFLPIVLTTNQAHLTQRQVEDIRLALEKSLKKLQPKNISGMEIGEALEYNEKGGWEVQHEFDDEPTFITPTNQDDEESSITLGANIPSNLRNDIASILLPILNAEAPPKQEK